jgi:acetoacetate decarboxylase
MKATEVLKRAFAMPLTQPAYPPGPYRFCTNSAGKIDPAVDPTTGM